LKLYLESPQDALKHFQLVASADPKDAYAAYYVGQCLAQSHKYDQAVEWYRKAVSPAEPTTLRRMYSRLDAS
jgi:tetratricopeptide (TPR) repeat protein